MAKTGLRSQFELETRSKHTKVNCEVVLSVDGRELPNMAVLGGALEAAIELIQDKVTESYKEVPARVENVANAVPQVSQPSAPATVVVPQIPKSEPEPEPVPFGTNKPWKLG